MHLFTSLLPLTALLFLALAVYGTAARSLGARVFHYEPTEQDRMFVSDPSAKVDGKVMPLVYISLNLQFVPIKIMFPYITVACMHVHVVGIYTV